MKKLALEAFRSISFRSLSITDHKPTDGITKSNTIIENFAKTNPARNRRISVPPQGGLFHWNISYRVLGYRVGGVGVSDFPNRLSDFEPILVA